VDESVDIILPTYRRPHTIAYSIQSVLQQTYPAFQLHVVGDGCDATTEEIVRSVADARVHFHRFPKAMGFGYVHRNQVLRQTAAPYIAYATDDDLWFPDHLERGRAALQQRNLGLVAFRSCHVQVPDIVDPYFFAFDWRTAFLRNWFMGSVNCIHHRWVFERVGYWNDQLFRFGDREFYNRVRVSAVPSAYVDDVTVLRFYAQHWDDHYASLATPPQQRYVQLLRDPEWCAALRRRAAAG